MAKAGQTGVRVKGPRKSQSPALAKARSSLKQFLDANKWSKLVELDFEVDGKTESLRAIQEPWGDKSMTILAASTQKYCDALNNMVLPERLSAIYHSDIKELEIIWTAYRLPPEHKPLQKRVFEFTFEGRKHNCAFRRASDRLLLISSVSYPSGVSDTGFRNLQSFNNYQHQDKEEEGLDTYGEPLCFWIDNVDGVTEKTLDLIRHLNFHIKYFDPLSPTVVIHPKVDPGKVKPRNRYIAGKFPEKIRSPRLNPTLLSFFAAAFEYEDPARQFQYFFRVIEYASGYYLEGKSRIAVKRALMAPDAATDPNRVAAQVIDAMLGYKADDTARFSATIVDLVGASLIWKEVQSNAAAFTTDTEFDGGFQLKALATRAGDDDEFGSRGLNTLATAFKEIRNHLSHGKDKHTGNAILPTSRNFNLLKPWVHLIAIAAGEVALYEGTP